MFLSPFLHYTNLVTIALWHSNTHTSAPSEVEKEIVWVNIGAFCLKLTPGTWDAEPRPRQTRELWRELCHLCSFSSRFQICNIRIFEGGIFCYSLIELVLKLAISDFYANYVNNAVFHTDSKFGIICVSPIISDVDENYANNTVFHADSNYENLFLRFFRDFSIFTLG